MAARNRLPPWHEQIRLSNGREVLIRPIRPADADPLRQGFALLEPDEIRQRFLHAVRELTPEMADKLARPDAKREFALVAAEPLPPGEALVGAVARASITESGREAEFAILVSHYIAGLGLGRHLMRRLVRWAKGRRLERLCGDVLEHNQPMLALAQSLGFRREQTDEPGLVRVVLDLQPGRGTHVHDHDEPQAA
ncbi:GNAT family N-acetyltransferase [Lysobacter sp. A6]|uniref:GNAT family N-acetyltransferase n=1 Tax=Noviluteimonas lactosilytica TaxID=2888523 RepID=A0ABS8JEW7_9GAMM|nr:GNAT family N-acetyltransferase [Lysobacter lactosilyticus]MCC8362102.1 GNAT family N-acetyltransferase [Lysobacter lactosilyticus]